jgi:hypothetical protein
LVLVAVFFVSSVSFVVPPLEIDTPGIKMATSTAVRAKSTQLLATGGVPGLLP